VDVLEDKMSIKSTFLTLIYLSSLIILNACSLKADYKGVINRQILGIDFSTEIEINCQSFKSRSIIHRPPLKIMDGIEEVSLNWEKIDNLAEHATQELYHDYREEFIEKPWMKYDVERQAFSYQKAVQTEYAKVCGVK
jgi:hypothetical protein